MPEPTIFSQIIQRKIPATIVYEDNDFIAFKDIHPKAPVHVLLVTKEPYPSLESIPLDSDLHGKILLVARKLTQQLGISKNYKIAMNVGAQVQAVPHFHLHLMGGWKNIQSPADAEVGI